MHISYIFEYFLLAIYKHTTTYLASFSTANTRFWSANTSPAAFLPASTPNYQRQLNENDDLIESLKE